MDNQKLFISMYHYTRDLKNSRYPKIKGLDISLFRKQMEFFKENCNVVRMEDVVSAVKGEKALPEKAVLLTFDDGYVDNYTYAFPVLEEFGFQGSFFIPGKILTTHSLLDVNKIHYLLASSDETKLLLDVKERMDFYRGTEFVYPSTDQLWEEYAIGNRLDGKEVTFIKRMLQTVLPERIRTKIINDLFEKYVGVTEEKLACELYMSEEQVRTLKRHGMYIGAHGYAHCWLDSLSKEKKKEDISKGLNVLEEFIPKTDWVMNYPYGIYDSEVLEFIKERGACIGLTTETNVAVIGKDSAFELPRLDCNDFPPKSENYKKFREDNNV